MELQVKQCQPDVCSTLQYKTLINVMWTIKSCCFRRYGDWLVMWLRHTAETRIFNLIIEVYIYLNLKLSNVFFFCVVYAWCMASANDSLIANKTKFVQIQGDNQRNVRFLRNKYTFRSRFISAWNLFLSKGHTIDINMLIYVCYASCVYHQ